MTEAPGVSKVTDSIPSWTELPEREVLAQLASEVPSNGLIVEVGCLYGGTTVVMAMANPSARIVSIDEFSWTPEGYPKATKELFLSNMANAGVKNEIHVIAMDSRDAAKVWREVIDFLFIDGGHSYDFVYADLVNFAPYARKVALHDYDNPFWPTIKKAVDDFLSKNPMWYLEEVVGTVVVLNRNEVMPMPEKPSKKKKA